MAARPSDLPYVADWSGKDLAGQDLRGRDFRRFDLTGANLSGADLRGARLDGALLDRARLRGANLADADLAGASLQAADATEANLDRTAGAFVQADGFIAVRASFRGAEWPNARLDGAQLDSSRWSGGRLDGASLLAARLDLARLDRAVLDRCDLDGASLVGARGRGVALFAATGRFRFDKADFRGADLRGLAFAELGFDGARLDGSRIDEAENRKSQVQLTALGWESSRFNRLRRLVWTILVAATLATATAARALGRWAWQKFEAWRAEPAAEEATDEGAEPADVEVGAEPVAEPEQDSEAEESEDEDDANVAYAAFERANRARAAALNRERAGRAAVARSRRRARIPTGPSGVTAIVGRFRRVARELVSDPDEASRAPSSLRTAAAEVFDEHREDRAASLHRSARRRDIAARRAVGTSQRRTDLARTGTSAAAGQGAQRAFEALSLAEKHAGRPAPALREAFSFAGHAEARNDRRTALDSGRFEALKRRVTLTRERSNAQVRTLRAASEARSTASAERADARLVVAIRQVASARKATGRAPPVSATHTAREMAEQARRAQQARDAERTRRREEAELSAMEAAVAQLEERREAEPGDDGATAQQRTAEIERNRGLLQAQRAAVQASAARAATATRDAAGALLGGVRAGVARIADYAPEEEKLEIAPGADLSRRMLDGRDFSNANLENADLRGSSLVGCRFTSANLRGARLDGADLTGARLEGVVLDDAVLDGAVLDQIVMPEASLVGIRAQGAQLGATPGLGRAAREALVRAGAESVLTEGRSPVRYVVAGLGIAAASMLVVYLADRFADERGLNPAALEQKATEARQAGDDDAAASAFSDLAAQADRADSKVDFLIEAATSAEDANDSTRALDLFEQAVAAAAGTPDLVRARLARANAWRRLDLRGRAVAEFRELLATASLAPDQIASAVVGLHDSLDENADSEARLAAEKALRACATDPERGSLAYALADDWTAAGNPDAARAALDAALAGTKDPTIASQVRLRIAQVQAEGGDVEGALALYRELATGSGGENASLGAAELLLRTGRDAEAEALLEPLYKSADHDVRARALRARAGLAERAGDTTTALASVRTILELDGVPASVLDEARIVLARLDPSAVDELVKGNPALRAELLLGRARALKESGERSDAREIWVELAENPDADVGVRADATLALAELQVEDGDAEGAVRRYDTMLQGTLATDVRERVSLARSHALLRGNKTQEAEAGFSALRAAAGPEIRPQCDLGLAEVAELQGQLSKAAELYAAVGRTDGPWALEALLSLGELRQKSGDLAQAAEAYRLARNRPGDHSRKTAADVALAEVLTEMGDPAASGIYATLLSSTDTSVRVAARLAVGNQKLSSAPGEARALFEEGLSDAIPGEMRTQLRAGWLAAAVQDGAPDEARSRLAAWFETENDAAERESLAASALRALRAGGAGSMAAELAPAYAKAGFEAAIEGALSLREAGDPARAAAALRAATAATAEDERWRKELLAEVLIEADDLDGADEVWRALGDGESRDAARFGRARVARARGNYEGALGLLDGLDDPRVPSERALVLEGLGRTEEAETLYLRLADDPVLETKSAGVVGLARVRLGRDDAMGALSALAKLPAIDPGYLLTAAQLRGDALLALGRVAEARDVYKALDENAEARIIRGLGLGECALASEDAPRALALFAEVFESTNDDFYKAHALAGVARAWAEAGNLDRAKLELQKLRSSYAEHADAIAVAAHAIER